MNTLPDFLLKSLIIPAILMIIGTGAIKEYSVYKQDPDVKNAMLSLKSINK